MPLHRIFLGSRDPLLDRAVRALAREFPPSPTNDRSWDLTELILVCPSQQARRRLLERLVAHASSIQRILLPPELTAPDHLLSRMTPGETRLASRWQAATLRYNTLRNAPTPDLAPLLPPDQSHSDHTLRSLASWLARTSEDLILEGLPLETLPHQLDELGIDVPNPERYQAIANLELSYLAALDRHGLIDRTRHTAQQIEHHITPLDRHILLLGVVTPTATLRHALANTTDTVTALIPAEPGHADDYDDLGTPIPERWADRDLGITDDHLRFVERAADLNTAVAEAIAHHATSDTPVTDIAVVSTDNALSEPIRASLTLAGIHADTIGSITLAQSPPAILLQLLARFVNTRRIDDLLVLLRHPDLLLFVRHHQPTADITSNWVGLLDRRAAELVDGSVDAQTQAHDAHQLKTLTDALLNLLPEDIAQDRTLSEWATPITQLLEALYDHPLHHTDNLPILTEAIQILLDQLSDWPALSTLELPEFSFQQAIDWLINTNAPGLNNPAEEDALPIIGLLELALNPSPILIVAGLNEGRFPTRPTPDRLLPESVRQRLGVSTAARRETRDLWALATAIESRPNITLIAAGKSAENDPLLPSLPLLGHDRATRIQRLNRFLNQRDHTSERINLVTPGTTSQFLLAHPPATIQPPSEISVTAFRDYLACPYRFYLKHIRKLQAVETPSDEIDAAGFGTLLHTVLATLIDVPANEHNSIRQLKTRLADTLSDIARDRLGTQRSPAIEVQLRQAHERLMPVADIQVHRWNDGWQIRCAEQSLQRPVTQRDHTITIRGKIDRIDHHPDLGWQVLDYKSFDSNEKTPRKTHYRPRRQQWVDLQLPIYLDLAARPPVQATTPIDAGYWILPAKPAANPLKHIQLCGWTREELESARSERDRILTAIIQGIYWPPSDPADYEDGYQALCADLALDRDELIQRAIEERP